MNFYKANSAMTYSQRELVMFLLHILFQDYVLNVAIELNLCDWIHQHKKTYMGIMYCVIIKITLQNNQNILRMTRVCCLFLLPRA